MEEQGGWTDTGIMSAAAVQGSLSPVALSLTRGSDQKPHSFGLLHIGLTKKTIGCLALPGHGKF
jgi:hypothetical protein